MSSDFLKCLIIVDLRQLYQENRRSSVTSQQRNTGELGSYRTTENQRVWSLETPSHKRQLNCSYYLHLPYVQATESETQGIELSSSQRKAQCSQETAGISRHATSGACNSPPPVKVIGLPTGTFTRKCATGLHLLRLRSQCIFIPIERQWQQRLVTTR